MDVEFEGGRHPRTIGWVGTTALALGGSNQSLFILGALLAAQGTAAVPLLIIGLLLSWMALPGWTELVLMWPDRVGGIASTCAEAFRPYSPVLANLTGTCYWWGWVPTCGLTALLSASALHSWFLPAVPVTPLACGIVVAFTLLNLVGVKWATRLAVVTASGSAALAFLSATVPVLTGHVDWHRASSFHLTVPFHGPFGAVTSAMAGLYLIGFAAPAFEAAACHVGEMKDPVRSVPRTMYASAGVATIYFVVLPVVWLGALGHGPLGGDLTDALGPTFAPIFGGGAKAAAVWFMVLNMFHGTLAPVTGVCRTLSQLAEDGLLPRILARRNRFDVPWVATSVTATLAIGFLIGGDPVWVIAAANLCYLIGITLPSVAVWLLRRNEPDRPRPYRARKGMIGAGLAAAAVWAVSTALGMEQFGMPTVLFSLVLAFSGTAAMVWRKWRDRDGAPRTITWPLHVKLTGLMLFTMALDGIGYLIAVQHASAADAQIVVILKDIFVAEALLTIAVGLVVPGTVAHAASEVADAGNRLARGALAEITRVFTALADDDLDVEIAAEHVEPVAVRTQDEVGLMARRFNEVVAETAAATEALRAARAALARSQAETERMLRSSVDRAAQQERVAQLSRAALAGEAHALRGEIAKAVADLNVDASGLLLDVTEDGMVVTQASGPWTPLVGEVLSGGEPEGPAIVCARSGEVILSTDLFCDPRFMSRRSLTARVRSGVWVPIRHGDQVVSVLAAVSARAEAFTADDVHYVESLANVLSAAVERNAAESELTHLALHDRLTGLPNRQLLLDRMVHGLARMQRRPSVMAVLFIDLDRFKVINDSVGHAAGDELLVAVAARLREVTRPTDTVCRFGGDEFVILLEDAVDNNDAVATAERIRRALAEVVSLASGDVVPHASIGIATTTDPGASPGSLLQDADAAMYLAKEEGRNRTRLFAEPLRERARLRLETEQALRRGIADGELRVHFQPVVELEGGRITAAEALVRWERPGHGLVGPDAFLGVAEDSGLIPALFEQVLAQACRVGSGWRAMTTGMDGPAMRVAVNVSPTQLERHDLVRRVAEALDATGLPADALVLEVTEGALMRDADECVQVLRRLKNLGVLIGIDDFGTGYSSLSYLRKFPVDILKIDKSFVRSLGQEASGASIVAATVALAKALNLATTAEGVETVEQAELLSELGCDTAQGYLFARPAPAHEVTALIGSGALAPTP